MKYELLKNLYYKDKSVYESEYLKRFNSDRAFHLDIDIKGNNAFFLMTNELYNQIYKIAQMDNALSLLCKELPTVANNQYIRKSLIGEIVGTNDIEQIHSSRKEIGEVLYAAKHKIKGNRFKDITKRYNLLLDREEYEFKSCADIRKIYDDLLYEEIKEENPEDLPDGRFFRKSSVDVRTVTDKIVHTGVQPEEKIIVYMDKALSFLDLEDINIFFRIAVFHYLFGYIHPFYDGNGRTSRFISSALLFKNLFTPLIAFRLSGTLKDKKSQYYKAFDICNDPKNKGDLTPFVYMFLDIITEAFNVLWQSVGNKKYLWIYYFDHINMLPDSSNQHLHNIYELLIQASLFSENGICKSEMEEPLKISRGAIDYWFRKIPQELLNDFAIGKTKYYKLNLEAFDKIIEESK